jgi:periplasmic divalent cation tolerance protein
MMSGSMSNEVHIAFCTCPDAAVAQSLATALVEAGLAACVNILPGILSVYRWEGNIQREAEVLLMIKTTADRLDELTASIRDLHPYEVPEVIAHPITAGHDSYIEWVRQCTTTQS